jgi:hypothetical protein
LIFAIGQKAKCTQSLCNLYTMMGGSTGSMRTRLFKNEVTCKKGDSNKKARNFDADLTICL